MRAKDFINESSGLYNRKVGDHFSNADSGQVLVFNGITSYPSSGKFNSLQERESVRAEVVRKLGVVQWVNANQEKSGQYLAFGIAELTDSSSGQKQYWGRYFKEIVGSMMKAWPNSEVPSGWKLKIKSAEKIAAGFDPQTLIGTEAVFDNVDQAAQHVINRLGADHVISSGLNQLLNGKLPVFVGMKDQLPALRDYLGEIMAPIALTRGLVKGAADQAQQTLLVDTVNNQSYTWAQCRVKWPMSISHNLVDSYMIAPNNFEVGISSKGGRGAKASVKNIWDIYEKIKDTNPQLLANYPKEVGYLEAIVRNTQFYGPLELASELGIIDSGRDQEIADEIKSMIRNPQQAASQDLAKFLTRKGADMAAPNYNRGYHVLASIATQVADQLSTGTKLNNLMKLLLNNSSMVQIYCTMAVKGNDAQVTGFNAIFPPKFEGNLKILANKGYSATGIKQKFVFDFV